MRTLARLATIVVLFFAVYAKAQQPAALLIRASQCLQAKGFIEASHSTQNLLFGYFLDSVSYPGTNVAYITQYTKLNRSRGYVFTVVYKERGARTDFDIQNNARFIRRKSGIDFVDPPLGGDWTQQKLVEGIEHAARQSPLSIPVKSIMAPLGLGECRSYIDPQ